VVRGGPSRSYGVEAARLAGVPTSVVRRARQVLSRIEANSHVAVGLQGGGAGRRAKAGGTDGQGPDQSVAAGGARDPRAEAEPLRGMARSLRRTSTSTPCGAPDDPRAA